MLKNAGFGCKISDDFVVENEIELVLGDRVKINEGVKILGKGRVEIGDYVKIHRNSLIISNVGVKIGHNSWIGERCVIDGYGGISIGNNVGIGINTQTYSHMAFGDTLAGCRFFNVQKLNIEDDVWICGSSSIAPVTIGKKTIVMLGGIVLENLEENRIFAGNPAQDVTTSFGGPPWISKTYEQKLAKFKGLLKSFKNKNSQIEIEKIVPVRSITEFVENDDKTYYDLNSRLYTKKLTDTEISFMDWLISYRGKFVPYEKPSKISDSV